MLCKYCNRYTKQDMQVVVSALVDKEKTRITSVNCHRCGSVINYKIEKEPASTGNIK